MLGFTSARQRNFFNYISLLQPVKVQLHFFGRKKIARLFLLPYGIMAPIKKTRKTEKLTWFKKSDRLGSKHSGTQSPITWVYRVTWRQTYIPVKWRKLQQENIYRSMTVITSSVSSDVVRKCRLISGGSSRPDRRQSNVFLFLCCSKTKPLFKDYSSSKYAVLKRKLLNESHTRVVGRRKKGWWEVESL